MIFEMKEVSKGAFPAVPVANPGGMSLLSLPVAGSPDLDPIPYGLIGLSTIILYVQSLASLHVLDRVTSVSHNVTNTCKRFFIIVLSVIYFKNQVTVWNVFGILVAMGGFFSYAIVHHNNKEQRKQGLHKK